jgi:hypothetical protein
VEFTPLITAVVSVIAGAGGATLLIRELLWLRYCRYIHDQAVARGRDPKPKQLIQAASSGRLGHSPKRRPQLRSSSESPSAEKSG